MIEKNFDAVQNVRIDKYICEKEKDLTRSAVQRMLEEGKIRVNNKVVKASYQVNEKDIIEIEEIEPEEIDLKPEEIPLEVIYEDKDILVINKEKGMVVHPRKRKQRRNTCKCSNGKV